MRGGTAKVGVARRAPQVQNLYFGVCICTVPGKSGAGTMYGIGGSMYTGVTALEEMQATTTTTDVASSLV